jgi:hypothetical protein
VIYKIKGVFMKNLKLLLFYGILLAFIFNNSSCKADPREAFFGSWEVVGRDNIVYIISENEVYAFVIGAERWQVTSINNWVEVINQDDNTNTIFPSGYKISGIINDTQIKNDIGNSIDFDSFYINKEKNLINWIVVDNTNNSISYSSKAVLRKIPDDATEEINNDSVKAVDRNNTINNERNNTVVETFNNEDDFNVILTDDNTGVIITSYVGTKTNVNIPSHIQGMPVKEIGGYAFAASGFFARTKTKITSLIIPSGVIKIGDAAFLGQDMLISAVLPDTVISIGWEAFNECSKLSSIRLPQGITLLSGNVFRNTNFSTFVVPEGVTMIEANAFANCKSLTSVTFPSTIKNIGRGAFVNCTSLTTVTFPETISSITWRSNHDAPGDTFHNCPKITIATQAKLKQLGYTGNF